MEKIIKDFIEFVETDSMSKNERKVADKVIKELERLGIEYIEDNTGEMIGGNTGNILGVLKGNPDKEAILFTAHMDRVVNGCGIETTINEGVMTSKGDTILAADNIAGVVTILNGVRLIKESGIDHGDIEVLFTVCEEMDIEGIRHFDYNRLKSKMAYCLDSSGRIGRVINKGISKASFDISISGKSAHAGSEPENGVNAIIGAGIFLSQVKDGRISEEMTANYGKIQGGFITNVVCDKVILSGEARSPIDEKVDEYKDHIYDVIAMTKKRINTAFELDFAKTFKGFEVGRDQRVSVLLKEAMTELGIEARFEQGGGGMDANRLNANGIKTLGVATGYQFNHTSDEQIALVDLVQSAELVKKIIELS